MATKKQKREAGIQKQAENLAKVTAERLAAQERDREIREEKSEAAKAEGQRLSDRFEAMLKRANTDPANEIVRKMQIAHSVSERPWNNS